MCKASNLLSGATSSQTKSVNAGKGRGDGGWFWVVRDYFYASILESLEVPIWELPRQEEVTDRVCVVIIAASATNRTIQDNKVTL